jgi:hypothetical protein
MKLSRQMQIWQAGHRNRRLRRKSLNRCAARPLSATIVLGDIIWRQHGERDDGCGQQKIVSKALAL